MRPLRGLQETRVATRGESGVLGFPSRRGLTPRVSGQVDNRCGASKCETIGVNGNCGREKKARFDQCIEIQYFSEREHFDSSETNSLASQT